MILTDYLRQHGYGVQLRATSRMNFHIVGFETTNGQFLNKLIGWKKRNCYN